MTNPWSTCELLYDENNGHFLERMKERSYSGPDCRDFLINGKKEPVSKKDQCSQDFKVYLAGWVVCCKLRCCNIVMGTIFHE